MRCWNPCRRIMSRLGMVMESFRRRIHAALEHWTLGRWKGCSPNVDTRQQQLQWSIPVDHM
jgi:hypothetical protein